LTPTEEGFWTLVVRQVAFMAGSVREALQYPP